MGHITKTYVSLVHTNWAIPTSTVNLLIIQHLNKNEKTTLTQNLRNTTHSPISQQTQTHTIKQNYQEHSLIIPQVCKQSSNCIKSIKIIESIKDYKVKIKNETEEV